MKSAWVHCTGVCLAVSLAACGGAQPRPEAPSGGAAPAPGSHSEATGGAAAPAVVKPPFSGVFRILTGTDGKQTIDFSALMKRAAGAGEVIIGFDEQSVSLGAWSLNKNERDPGRTLYSLCRGRAALSPQWNGNTMILPSAFSVNGQSNALVVETQRIPPNKTKTTSWTLNNECSFSLEAGKYRFEVVKSDGDGPSTLRMHADKVVFELERAAPIESLDIKSVVESLKSE